MNSDIGYRLSSFFFFSFLPLLAHYHWLFIANDRDVQITTDLPPICFEEKMGHLLSVHLLL
jgi:hypothetical protein